MFLRYASLAAVAVVLLAACGAADPGAPTTPLAPAVAAPGGPTPPELRLGDAVAPREYALELSLDPARAEVGGVVTIAVEVRRPTRQIWLHGKRLTVSRATVSAGRELAATVTAHGEVLGLALPESIGAGPATIRVEYAATASATDTEGLFRQADGGRGYLFSQFEPTGARLAFPCFDEPGFKVPWQLTLKVPSGMVALSNTPEVRRSTADDVTTIEFDRTPPMPSYLVAVAVGPFELVDLGRAGRGRTPMRIAVPRGRAAEARYARRATGQILEQLERYFDSPYPFAKLDSVAVPNFPGAMENAGLVTYSASLLLARPNEETALFQRRYAEIAAHELGHHWFGNLVTLAWWDDTWLNEAFATFVAVRVVDDWQPAWKMAVERVKSAEGAYAADSLASARAIHAPVTKHNDIMGTFDAIAYLKGGAVLGMVEAWMGRDRFQRAVRAYLAKHAWGNASAGDFFAALAAGSDPDLAGAFRSFVEQPGVPRVSLALDCAAGQPAALALAQERFLPAGSTASAAQTWSVPMCVGVPRGKGRVEQCFLLREARQRVPLEGGVCPAWVDGNVGGRGYYRVAYAGDLGQRLLTGGKLDAAGRIAALFNLRAMVESGQGALVELLAALPVFARDREPSIAGAAVKLVAETERLVEPDRRDRYGRFVTATLAPAARALGWRPRSGESSQTAELRLQVLGLVTALGDDPATVAGARAMAASYLARPGAFDPKLAAVALAAAIRAGEPGLFERLEAAFAASGERPVRAALLAGMAATEDADQRQRVLAHLTSGKLAIEETIGLMIGAMGPRTRDEAWSFIVRNLDAVVAALPFMARPFVTRVATVFCDAEHREVVDRRFRAAVGGLPGGEKQVTETLEQLDLCIARRARLGGQMAAFLDAQAAPAR